MSMIQSRSRPPFGGSGMKVLTAMVAVACLHDHAQAAGTDAMSPSQEQDTDEATLLQTMLKRQEMHTNVSSSDPIEVRPSAAVPGAPPDVVKFGILVKNFFGVDLLASTFYLDLVVTLKWVDSRAVKVLDQAGVASIDHWMLSSQAAAQRIWLPDVSVTNHDLDGLEVVSSNTRINRDGSLVQVQRLLVRVREAFDVTLFPFDTQTLNVKLASTSLLSDALVLEPMAQQSQAPAISRFNNLYYCVIKNVSRRDGSMVIEFDVTGDMSLGKLNSPMESTLTWTNGQAKPASMKLSHNDPSRISGELIFDNVPDAEGIHFTYGSRGYTGVSVVSSTLDEADASGIAPSLFEGSEYSLVDSRLQSYEEITGPLHKIRGEFSFRVERSQQGYVESVFLPACLLVGISWTVFFFPLEAAFTMPRVATSLLAFLSFMTLAQEVEAQIPARSGLAWINIFMGCEQILMFATIVLNITELYIFHHMNLQAFASKLGRELQVIFPLLATVTNVIVFSSSDGKRLLFTQIIMRLILVATVVGYIAATFWRIHLERVATSKS